MKLIIGNKNYSSWSLRAWLMMQAFKVDFEEVKIFLSRPETSTEILKYNRAGKVPVLHDADLIVWDSLAICEYISERYLDGSGWPSSLAKRAQARACSAEMHSGFFMLRDTLPMNCRASNRKVPMTPDLRKEIDRIDSLWTGLLTRYSDEGEYLFGRFSIADCMFAPVVFRFLTYGISVSDQSRRYMDTILAHPKVQLWREQACQEQEVIDAAEAGK